MQLRRWRCAHPLQADLRHLREDQEEAPLRRRPGVAGRGRRQLQRLPRLHQQRADVSQLGLQVRKWGGRRTLQGDMQHVRQAHAGAGRRPGVQGQAVCGRVAAVDGAVLRVRRLGLAVRRPLVSEGLPGDVRLVRPGVDQAERYGGGGARGRDRVQGRRLHQELVGHNGEVLPVRGLRRRLLRERPGVHGVLPEELQVVHRGVARLPRRLQGHRLQGVQGLGLVRRAGRVATLPVHVRPLRDPREPRAAAERRRPALPGLDARRGGADGRRDCPAVQLRRAGRVVSR
mmetsp:Transcript_53801/g.155280  ORF Transcript_53801/g.155280 Transcript_53801/m.155280 type:complete len:287 (-) Transcript_53801:50-910(-)